MSFHINESFNVHEMGSIVPESYSRQLDERVLEQEMPYGYSPALLQLIRAILTSAD